MKPGTRVAQEDARCRRFAARTSRVLLIAAATQGFEIGLLTARSIGRLFALLWARRGGAESLRMAAASSPGRLNSPLVRAGGLVLSRASRLGLRLVAKRASKWLRARACDKTVPLSNRTWFLPIISPGFVASGYINDGLIVLVGNLFCESIAELVSLDFRPA